MDDEYFEVQIAKWVPDEFPIYLEVLGQLNGMKFKIGELEEKLARMTDKPLAQRAIEWGKSRGIIEEDSVEMAYYINIKLAYGDVETHPEYFGIDDDE